ncbi:MAG: hypothetical protein CM1200mP38_0670 [Dehalococcoidia bacterium]|nr:MAG: hypothetical protein CM1200mP38_0670 [Dehalococcoidia bacterium]
MKYVYAFDAAHIIHLIDRGGGICHGNALNSFLEKVSGMGFDGIELGLDYFSDDFSEAKEKHQNFKNY